MRILYHHRTLADGAEGIHISEMINAFRELGHEVRINAFVGEEINAKTSKNQYWQIAAGIIPRLAYEIGEIGYNIGGYLSLMKAIREFGPDLIYDRYASFNYSAVAVARKFGIPLFLEVNSPYSYQRKEYETVHFANLLLRFERKICSDADYVLVVSTPLREYLKKIGVPSHKIIIIPNGANPNLFDPKIDGTEVRKKFNLQNSVVIGFVGILRNWHGLELLLSAFQQLNREIKKLHLLIVGDGPIESELKQWVERNDLKKSVTFTGRLPHSYIRKCIAAMDIAISPRATFYASPMKILEYMAMAKAVVAPDMPNIRDIITPGKDGILFKPESVSSLIDKIKMLVENDDIRKRIGRAAREKIERKFNWRDNACRIIELYNSMKQQQGF